MNARLSFVSGTVATGFLCLATGVVATPHAADVIDELKACAGIAGRDPRFECYEALGQRVLDAEKVAITSAATPALTASPDDTVPVTVPTTSPPPADEISIGGTRFEKKTEPAIEILVKVKSCKQGVDKRWYFLFESGQIWKQVNDRHLIIRDCKSMATITRDMFGYKMQLEGRERKIRIERTR